MIVKYKCSWQHEYTSGEMTGIEELLYLHELIHN